MSKIKCKKSWVFKSRNKYIIRLHGEGGKLHYLDRVSVYNVQSHKLQWRSRKVVSLVDLLPPKAVLPKSTSVTEFHLN